MTFWMTTTIAVLASFLASSQAHSQEGSVVAAPGAPTTTAAPPAAESRASTVPWNVGEKLRYEVRFGAIKVGNAEMDVRGIETIRGRPAYHVVFSVKGGTFFYKVNDLYESWIDTATLASLRFIQDVNEGKYDRRREFEIFPDRQVYTQDGGAEQKSVDNPLDDGSFLYFIRTVPLTVGSTVEYNRYFRPDRNPVRIRVLRRETVKVPAGTFETIVIQPIIKTRGIFADKGEAEVWITDDERRMMVQLKSKLSFGSLNLFLTSAQPAPTTATAEQ